MRNKISRGEVLEIKNTGGTLITGGSPYCLGHIPLVITGDVQPGATGVGDRSGIFKLTVKAVDGTGNVPVTSGDRIFYSAGDTPVLSRKDTGVLYGYAYGDVPTGATASIPVLLA